MAQGRPLHHTGAPGPAPTLTWRWRSRRPPPVPARRPAVAA